jgi:hypothetical protein
VFLGVETKWSVACEKWLRVEMNVLNYLIWQGIQKMYLAAAASLLLVTICDQVLIRRLAALGISRAHVVMRNNQDEKK